MMSKDALKFLAIKERIAQLTADYEEKVADLRADFTLAVEEMNEQVRKLQDENKLLRDANAGYLEKLGGEDVVEKD